MNNKILQIGIFFDGNFVKHISDFYLFKHEIHSRLSLKGLQELAIKYISTKENTDLALCKIVDSRIYRARYTAKSAEEKDILYGERVFDDACMYDGIVTQYIPLKKQRGRVIGNNSNVWLALDAYESSIHKNLDVVIVVSSDSDFRHLIKKLHSLGTRTLLLSWNIQWEQDGELQVTKTSRDLTEESTWYIDVAKEFEENSEELNHIFVQKGERELKYSSNLNDKPKSLKGKLYDNRETYLSDYAAEIEYDPSNRIESEIQSLKINYGFIVSATQNIFFHSKDLINCNYSDLQVGDAVEFQISFKPDGEPIAKQIKLLVASSSD